MRRCKHETARSKPTAERRICFKAEQALPKPTEFGLFNVHLLKVISIVVENGFSERKVIIQRSVDVGCGAKFLTRTFFDLKLCYLQQCPSPKLNDVTDNSAM
ncbi:hypothetical protein T4C_10509 [Trichinella pseudospiralis]|uniref:Uncharacterized protein n=1 Tax=Trichinella pseudospiralis TaxID=6337 RepID=A0A0V1JSG9_TRIPS|nr:hypothetical protein T4C_10509 [Trichinella pseudospiralis]